MVESDNTQSIYRLLVRISCFKKLSMPGFRGRDTGHKALCPVSIDRPARAPQHKHSISSVRRYCQQCQLHRRQAVTGAATAPRGGVAMGSEWSGCGWMGTGIPPNPLFFKTIPLGAYSMNTCGWPGGGHRHATVNELRRCAVELSSRAHPDGGNKSAWTHVCRLPSRQRF